MKNCKETSEMLSDYVEGTLGEGEAASLRKHLSDCPPCEAFLRSFKLAGEATRAVLMRSVPQDFHDRLKTFLRSRTGPH